MSMRFLLQAALASALAMFLIACGDTSSDRPTVAYVTNGDASFWTIAAAGAVAGAEKFDVDCEVKKPGTPADQKATLEDLLTRGVDGIAISPIDPNNQIDVIDQACDNTHVITHDSDAPKTKRLCYVGMDNYDAGVLAGKLVKEALPDGGSIMIFIGRVEQDNAKNRRQGMIDEVLGKARTPGEFDPIDGVLEGNGYTILGTRTDLFDQPKAKANAEDAIVRYPDLGCMVGLFAYNPPMCLEALRAADKLGQIKVVGFDEADETLQGIIDGTVVGTVVQDPYMYGYHSVRIMAGLARDDKSVMPDNGFLDVPAKIIRRPEVEEFWAHLKKLLGIETETG